VKESIRVLFCGDRNWTDYDLVQSTLQDLKKHFKIALLIHGGANGADTLAGKAAKKFRIPVRVFRADWRSFGKAAGPKYIYV